MTDQHERTSGRLLLHRLLDYIHEQAKEVDPRGHRLGAVKGFVRRSDELVGLPGVESDLKVAGDHIWLRIQRLEGNAPPPMPDSQKGLFRVSKNPEGPLPELDEAALLHWLEKAGREKTPQERLELEAHVRAEALQSLVDYAGLWNAWAEGECPRRRTITLYADLFALKHQLEAEETAKPQEFVCGIGISYWQLQFDGSSIPFEYPLLTQAVEISLDDRTLALEVRPRAWLWREPTIRDSRSSATAMSTTARTGGNMTRNGSESWRGQGGHSGDALRQPGRCTATTYWRSCWSALAQ